MSNKSKFLKATKLAIAGVVLGGSISSCSMMPKHNCASKGEGTKAEKSKCSGKNSCSSKHKCSSKHSCSSKNSCSSKK